MRKPQTSSYAYVLVTLLFAAGFSSQYAVAEKASDKAENYTAPYDTDTFDVTTRISCNFDPERYPAAKNNPDFKVTDCPAGINRGPEPGQTAIAIMRPDKNERIIHLDGDEITSPTGGQVSKELISDNWTVTVDDGVEIYIFPQAVLDRG